MTETKIRVPALRFPGFDGEWERKRLGDVTTTFSGGTPRSTNVNYYKGDIPFIKSGEIHSDVTDQHLSAAALKESSAKMVNKGDVLFALYGATSGEVSISKINGAINQAVLCVRSSYVNHNIIHNILQLLKEKILTKYLQGGQGNLSAEIFKSIKVTYPVSRKEQKKIADFLSTIDERIGLLKRRKQELETYKRGVMQQIFSRSLRFKAPNGKHYPEWEEKQLKDVLFEHKTINKAKNIKEIFSVAKHRGVINQIEHLGRSYAGEDTNNYKVVFPNDIVYTKSPTSEFPFGIIKQNKTDRTGIVSVLYAVYKPINQNIGVLLDAYSSSPIRTYNYLNPLVQKGAKNTMNIGNHTFLDGAKLPLPNFIEEQQKIADFLSAIDNKIELCERQIADTEKFKKGLLQQMFV